MAELGAQGWVLISALKSVPVSVLGWVSVWGLWLACSCSRAEYMQLEYWIRMQPSMSLLAQCTASHSSPRKSHPYTRPPLARGTSLSHRRGHTSSNDHLRTHSHISSSGVSNKHRVWELEWGGGSTATPECKFKLMCL